MDGRSLFFRFSALPKSDRWQKIDDRMTIRFDGNRDITGARQEADRFLGPANIISYNDIILIMLDFLISIKLLCISLLLLLL